MDEEGGQTMAGWLLAGHGLFQLGIAVLSLGVIWLMCIAFGGLGAAAAVGDGEPGAAVVVFLMFVGMALLTTLLLLPFLLLDAASAVAGRSLIRGGESARIPATILAALGMMRFPMGMMVGIGVILLLWVPAMQASSSPRPPRGKALPAS